MPLNVALALNKTFQLCLDQVCGTSPPRQVEDPAYRQLLKSVTRGECPTELAPRRLDFVWTVKADLTASHFFIDASPPRQVAHRDFLDFLTRDECPTELEVTGLEIFVNPAT